MTYKATCKNFGSPLWFIEDETTGSMVLRVMGANDLVAAELLARKTADALNALEQGNLPLVEGTDASGVAHQYRRVGDLWRSLCGAHQAADYYAPAKESERCPHCEDMARLRVAVRPFTPEQSETGEADE